MPASNHNINFLCQNMRKLLLLSLLWVASAQPLYMYGSLPVELGGLLEPNGTVWGYGQAGDDWSDPERMCATGQEQVSPAQCQMVVRLLRCVLPAAARPDTVCAPRCMLNLQPHIMHGMCISSLCHMTHG